VCRATHTRARSPFGLFLFQVDHRQTIGWSGGIKARACQSRVHKSQQLVSLDQTLSAGFDHDLVSISGWNKVRLIV
jgi:hypothetical protein